MEGRGRPPTSSDVQALHGQHPVVVGGVIEATLHHRIVGQLLQDFHGLILPPSLVKRWQEEVVWREALTVGSGPVRPSPRVPPPLGDYHSFQGTCRAC